MLEKFEGKQITVNAPSYVVFSQLSDLQQFVNRLPEEYRNKVTVNGDSIEGEYSGMRLGLKVVERKPNSTIVMKPTGQFPLECSVILNMQDASASQTNLKLSIEAEMNFMIKAMMGKKIQQMVDKLSEQMAAAAAGASV